VLYNAVADILHAASAKEAPHFKSKAIPCAENTRAKIRAMIREWIESPTDTTPIFWLNGPPGIGKSSIAKSVAVESESRGRLAASFFFTGSKEVTSPKHVFPTIAYQIHSDGIVGNTKFAKLQGNPHIHDRLSLPRQACELLEQPLERSPNDTSERPSPKIVIIDAADECTDDEDKNEVRCVLSLIASLGDRLTADNFIPVRFLIASAQEEYIENCLKGADSKHTYREHTLTLDEAKADVAAFLTDNLKGQGLSDSQIQKISAQSGGLFVHAATVQRFFTSKDGLTTEERLEALDKDPRVLLKQDTPLGILYYKILCVSGYFDFESDKPTSTQQLVHKILLLYDPLPSSAIERLFRLLQGKCQAALEKLRSVIHVNGDEPVDTYHASFRDYVLNHEYDPRCTVDPSLLHAEIAWFCLTNLNEAMTEQLKFSKEQKDAVHYSCRYWALHLKKASPSQNLVEVLVKFGGSALYFWLEGYISLNDNGDAISSLHSVVEWAVSDSNPSSSCKPSNS
jgi:hypothetical protein